MGLLDRQDLLDLDDILLLLDDIKYREGPADMQAIDCRRVRILGFFLVFSRKRVFLEFQDLLDDDPPGFWGEPFYKFPCPSLDDNGKHALLLPGMSVVLQDLVRVEGYELASLIDPGDHLPITVILLPPEAARSKACRINNRNGQSPGTSSSDPVIARTIPATTARSSGCSLV